MFAESSDAVLFAETDVVSPVTIIAAVAAQVVAYYVAKSIAERSAVKLEKVAEGAAQKVAKVADAKVLEVEQAALVAAQKIIVVADAKVLEVRLVSDGAAQKVTDVAAAKVLELEKVAEVAAHKVVELADSKVQATARAVSAEVVDAVASKMAEMVNINTIKLGEIQKQLTEISRLGKLKGR